MERILKSQINEQWPTEHEAEGLQWLISFYMWVLRTEFWKKKGFTHGTEKFVKWPRLGSWAWAYIENPWQVILWSMHFIFAYNRCLESKYWWKNTKKPMSSFTIEELKAPNLWRLFFCPILAGSLGDPWNTDRRESQSRAFLLFSYSESIVMSTFSKMTGGMWQIPPDFFPWRGRMAQEKYTGLRGWRGFV